MPSRFAQRVERAVQVGIEQLVVHLAAHVRKRGCARREPRVRENAVDAAHHFKRRIETALYLSLIGNIHDFSVSSTRARRFQLLQCLRIAISSTPPHHDVRALARASHEKAQTDAAVRTRSEHHAASKIKLGYEPSSRLYARCDWMLPQIVREVRLEILLAKSPLG